MFGKVRGRRVDIVDCGSCRELSMGVAERQRRNGGRRVDVASMRHCGSEVSSAGREEIEWKEKKVVEGGAVKNVF